MTAPAADSLSSAIVPYLFYDDVQHAIMFLEEAFGFVCVFKSPDPGGSGLAHAQLAHATGRVMLGKVGPGLRPLKSAHTLPALHSGVYVFVDDVDGHCARAKKMGAEVILEPGDQPWGDRMYAAIDFEGHFWMFAKHL